jgi:hypothetical protein
VQLFQLNIKHTHNSYFTNGGTTLSTKDPKASLRLLVSSRNFVAVEKEVVQLLQTAVL